MSREKRHLHNGKNKVSNCGAILRRLYSRNDTGRKTKFIITEFLLCERCNKIVKE